MPRESQPRPLEATFAVDAPSQPGLLSFFLSLFLEGTLRTFSELQNRAQSSGAITAQPGWPEFCRRSWTGGGEPLLLSFPFCGGHGAPGFPPFFW